MGYFPNATAGELYEAHYCNHCIHQENCSIWNAHLLHSYEECNNDDSILHILIPRSEDKLSNEKCTMFLNETQFSRMTDAIANYQESIGNTGDHQQIINAFVDQWQD